MRLGLLLVVLLGLTAPSAVVPSKLLVSVDVSLDAVKVATPLQLFEGQSVHDAALAFCVEFNLLPAGGGADTPVVQQLAQVLLTRLKQQQQADAAKRPAPEPMLSVTVTLDDQHKAVLQHFAGRDPHDEAVEFCAQHTQGAGRAQQDACVQSLEHELRSRLADLAGHRIRGAVTGSAKESVVLTVPVELADGRMATLELLQNERPADAARRFLETHRLPTVGTEEGQQLLRTLENALNSRLTSAVQASSSLGNALLFTIPLTVNQAPATLEIFEGQSSVAVAEAFCHRPEHQLKGQALSQCIQQIEVMVREKIAALMPMVPDLVAPMALETSSLPKPQSVEDEPLFTLPVTLGELVTAVPYYPQFTANQTATAFCTTHWDSIVHGTSDGVELGDCTGLIRSTIEGVLDRIVQRNPALASDASLAP